MQSNGHVMLMTLTIFFNELAHNNYTSRIAGTRYDFCIMLKVRMLMDGTLNERRKAKHFVGEQPEKSMPIAICRFPWGRDPSIG